MNDTTEQQMDEQTGEVLPIRADHAMIAAEISQEVATARAYPRRQDPVIVREIISRATLNQEIASECVYRLPRDNKQIPGPSIRFAEIVRAAYGNIRVATRFEKIDVSDPTRAAVIVAGVAYDSQTNSSETLFERRSIMTSAKGGRPARIYGPDMIAQTAGAARSIVRRNAILAIVPKALWVEGYHAALNVIKGSQNTLAERRQKAFDAFVALGAKPEEICAALGVKEIGEISLEHMPSLVGMWTAIKEGETVASILGRATEERGEPAHETVKSPLQDQKPASGKGGAMVATSGGTGGGLRGSTAVAGMAMTGGGSQETARPGATVAAGESSTEMPPGPQDAERATVGLFGSTEPDKNVPTKVETGLKDETEPKAIAYVRVAKMYLDHETSPAKIKDWWSRERDVRKKIDISSEQLEDLSAAKDARLDTLKK